MVRALAAKEVDLTELESRKKRVGRERLRIVGAAVKSALASHEHNPAQGCTSHRPRRRMKKTALVTQATFRARNAHRRDLELDDDGDDPMDGAGDE